MEIKFGGNGDGGQWRKGGKDGCKKDDTRMCEGASGANGKSKNTQCFCSVIGVCFLDDSKRQTNSALGLKF